MLTREEPVLTTIKGSPENPGDFPQICSICKAPFDNKLDAFSISITMVTRVPSKQRKGWGRLIKREHDFSNIFNDQEENKPGTWICMSCYMSIIADALNRAGIKREIATGEVLHWLKDPFGGVADIINETHAPNCGKGDTPMESE